MWENCHDYNPVLEKTIRPKKRIPAWVGIDLDSTLAMYDGWKGPEHIGPPIPSMVELVKSILEFGLQVKIFTARVSDPEQKEICEKAIKAYCLEHIGQELEVTCVKDMGMVLLIDDRAIQAGDCTGELVYRKLGRLYDGKVTDAQYLPIYKNRKC